MPKDPEFEKDGDDLYGTLQDYIQFLRMIPNYGQLRGNSVPMYESDMLQPQSYGL